MTRGGSYIYSRKVASTPHCIFRNENHEEKNYCSDHGPQKDKPREEEAHSISRRWGRGGAASSQRAAQGDASGSPQDHKVVQNKTTSARTPAPASTADDTEI